MLDRFTPYMLSILRIVAGLLFFLHGPQKLIGFPPSPRPAPELFSMLGAAATLEVIGGALLIIGLFTRPVAFVMSGLMAFAYFIAHAPRSFWPTSNGGDAAILFCFLFLYLVFAGPGPWSLDARRKS
ncbi:DoxX family protein [Sediminicoccus sp. BL-A-41-H5]|uniref:DoxX family protein n=1 Tax=Sediminicoccus sp. BL-A-41-H5 TaxID=3421106 RepID=UPI003D670AC0